MRKIFLAVALLTVGLSQAQWSFELGMGGHFAEDQRGSVLDDNFNHYNGTIRYMLNPKAGLGIAVGHDNLSFINDVDVVFNRLNLNAYVDVLDVLDLDNRSVSLLLHGGPGISNFTQKRPVATEREFAFNLSGGSTVIFALGKKLGLKFDWTTTSNFNQGLSLDYSKESCDSNITSIIHNFSGGLVYYIGKNRDIEKRKQRVDTIMLKPTVIDRTVTKRELYTVVQENKRTCDCDCIGYTYYDVNKFEVLREHLSQIEKVSDCLTSEKKIVLTGWSCPVLGTVDYNIELAEKRVEAIRQKLLSVGVHDHQIEVVIKGKDYSRGLDESRPLARRVQMKVVDK